MKTLLATAAIALTALAGGAQAATVYAQTATIVTDGPRGTADNRDDITNALGASLGDFFELGFGGVVDFTFGRLFTGPGNVVEVTFGNAALFLESANVFAGISGDASSFVQVGQLSNVASQGPSGQSFNFSGTFDTLRIADTTSPDGRANGGYDVDRVGVSPVPLPASALLLLAGLGGLGAVRRMRKPA
jgi:hypothetical protein